MNEIGEILKQARIDKGYTLDDLQQITKIQKRYLEAIEEGNIEVLPGRFYARAFVRQYADIVGLNGDELLEQHLTEISSDEVNEEFTESISSSPSRVKGKKDSFLNTINDQLPTILIFILAAAILVIIYFAFRGWGANDSGDNPMISDEQNQELVKPQPEDQTDNDEEAEDTEETDDTETSTDEEETKEQNVTVSNSTGDTTTYTVSGPHPADQQIVLSTDAGESWVSIQVDGKTVDSKTLAVNDSLSADFTADAETVTLRIGNANVTNVSLNDIELDYGENAQGTVQNMIINFVK